MVASSHESLRDAPCKTITTTQIPCPPAEMEDDDHSLHHLQQRTQWLIENHKALGKVCMAIAGGGGHALSTLAATPGASQLLLEGTVTYDRSSFQTYVGKTLPSDKSFSFSSAEAATLVSRAALLQGMQLQSRSFDSASANLLALRDTVGLGSASTLKTTTQGGMSKTGKPSHGNIVATHAVGSQVGMELVLNCPTQSRFQQDVFCSHMILRTLEAMAKLNTKHSNVAKNGMNGISSISHKMEPQPTKSEDVIDPRKYNGVTIEQWQMGDKSNTFVNEDPVKSAANRILSGDEEAVLLLPRSRDNTSDDDASHNNKNSFLESLVFPVLPDNCLIFPGSFNPPHQGHVGLARAAISKTSTNNNNNNSSSSSKRPLVFEISITNVDKPSMDPEEVARRVSQFRDVLYQQQNDDQGIPEWGILLTSAPLFADKVNVLRQYAPAPLQSNINDNSPATDNRWSFVIGTDTMVRILNPKYYDNSYENMLQAQRSMGADFVVGGRLEQMADGSGEKFVTGEHTLEGLPEDVKDLFVLLAESDFRVDISSTELRAQQGQEQETIK